ncbi:MAG: hypothetical protein Q9209_007239 [Squamulea sp. 1 TL-2023]
MADPFSIAAGVGGLVTAAAQISTLLVNFITSSRNAPQTAQVVLIEVRDIEGIISHLQKFLLGTEVVATSSARLLQVDQVVTIMSGCILTFSELEKLLDRLKADGKGILNRIQWARKEKVITNLIQRLQHHKASLSLLLQLLNGDTAAETKKSVDRLNGLIERCYEGISSRIGNLECCERQQQQHHRDSLPYLPDLEDDTASIITVTASTYHNNVSELLSSVTSMDTIRTYDFTEALRNSQVYRRNNALDSTRLSVFSRDTCSMSWSCFSGMSLAEISNLSVIDLPITTDELWNPLRSGSSQTWSFNHMTSNSPRLAAVELPANEPSAVELPSSVPQSHPVTPLCDSGIGHDAEAPPHIKRFRK